jgi:predicted RNase H-like HicB family nuclease
MGSKYEIIIFWSEEDEAFVARCLELPSMAAHGQTAAQALEEVRQAVDAAVEWMREEGEAVPEPMQLSSYRGNILFRTTPETHRELSLRAQESGVSLNQYLSLVVQRGLAAFPEGFGGLVQREVARQLANRGGTQPGLQDVPRRRQE